MAATELSSAQDAARLGAVKARVDPDGTVLANHPV
jgi:hypothetical protein